MKIANDIYEKAAELNAVVEVNKDPDYESLYCVIVFDATTEEPLTALFEINPGDEEIVNTQIRDQLGQFYP